ncbi:MAG TPA: glycosyltransferase [Bacteroidia bacterium]|jgi:glycosyltransferase involved in cell wall biosynthesis|nr:glycosyltransferase [Bacteroidia bacterium]
MGLRILLLSDVNSPHTRKIAGGLSAEGSSVGIFSLTKQDSVVKFTGDVKVFDGSALDREVIRGNLSGKLAYLKTVRSLKKTITEFNPDIVHAHYASSYGLLGKLSGFHPLVVSAWGSDLLDFPNSTVKRLLMKRILHSADQVMCTSKTLSDEVKKISGKDSLITPFGIDVTEFAPRKTGSFFPDGTLVFGTVKSLEKVYGTDILIRAFAEAKKHIGEECGLLLVGGGSLENELMELAQKLGVNESVHFVGRIDHTEVPRYHNAIDIFMNLSRYESFGVSVLESMSCGKPVIVSDTGGLAEIVSNGVDGIKVPVEDIAKAAEAMIILAEDHELRKRMGEMGRKKVIDHYEWSQTIKLISERYQQMLKNRK